MVNAATTPAARTNSTASFPAAVLAMAALEQEACRTSSTKELNREMKVALLHQASTTAASTGVSSTASGAAAVTPIRPSK
jgi:hypothetical protein